MRAVSGVRNVRLIQDAASSREPALVDVQLADGKVVAVAAAGELTWGDRTEAPLDGEGTWLVPGLWDHHVHATQWALSAQREDLGACRSALEAANRMSTVGPLIDGRRVGAGFRDIRWPDAPQLALLDGQTGEVPTYLINADVHSVWMNSAAFRREGYNTSADGVLREDDAFEISRRLNSANPVVADTAVFDAARRAASRGVVGIVDFDLAWNAEAWSRRALSGFDLHQVEFAVYPADLERAIGEGLATGDLLEADQSGLIRMGPLKIISDGSLGTRTAACSRDYVESPGERGVLNVSPTMLQELLLRATEHHIEIALHAIGDVAVAAALDAFARTGARGTIEHAQLVNGDDLERFSRLGVVASVQPQHALDDRDSADALWAHQVAIPYPLASLHKAGITVTFGSDAPVAPLDPWMAIAAAMSRTEDLRAAWHPEERVSVETALTASTRPGTSGDLSIRRGRPADLVLIGENPLNASAKGLRQMPVHATLLRGKITHLE